MAFHRNISQLHVLLSLMHLNAAVHLFADVSAVHSSEVKASPLVFDSKVWLEAEQMKKLKGRVQFLDLQVYIGKGSSSAGHFPAWCFYSTPDRQSLPC